MGIRQTIALHPVLREKIQDTLSNANDLRSAADRLASEEDVFFSHRFLLQRPLLRAILSEQPTVLLIDEIDRVDAEFEAFLLEVLSDFQISVPELGTMHAVHKPIVLLTSNNTAELSEALKRRCLYLFIDYPTVEQELAVVLLKVPELSPRLRAGGGAGASIARHGAAKIAFDLARHWTGRGHVVLNASELDRPTVESTLSVLLKHEGRPAYVRAIPALTGRYGLQFAFAA
jgi:hypothetical protein